MNIRIEQASAEDARIVAVMVGELLEEIMRGIGARVFRFSLPETVARARDFLEGDKYTVFQAREAGSGAEAGFIALTESHALYAEGAFGLIPELYVRPRYRSHGVGGMLLGAALAFGRSRGWKRLEVTTPPLPEFDRALRFYERQGFAVTGGRKLKLAL
jgi:GNAT superfamily N-acetyltransferase